MYDRLQKEMNLLNHSFQNCQLFSELVEPLSRNRQPNMTKNEHVYAICYRLEVAGDVISGENFRTVEGYALLYFEVANFSSFRDIQKQGAHQLVGRAGKTPTRLTL